MKNVQGTPSVGAKNAGGMWLEYGAGAALQRIRQQLGAVRALMHRMKFF